MEACPSHCFGRVKLRIFHEKITALTFNVPVVFQYPKALFAIVRRVPQFVSQDMFVSAILQPRQSGYGCVPPPFGVVIFRRKEACFQIGENMCLAVKNMFEQF